MAYPTYGLSGGTTTSSHGSEPARIPSVDSALNRLRERLSEACRILDSVDGRFAGVLRNQPPMPVEKSGPSPSAGCGLADAITELEVEAGRVCSRLHSIVDRCEL